MKDLRLNFFIDWKEYRDAERFVQREESLIQPDYLLGSLLIVTSIFLWYSGLHYIFIILASILGILYILTSTFRGLGLRQRWKREPILNAEHNVDISEDGIHYVLDGIESNLSWNYYQRWIETPTSFLLIYGENVFNLFPKRSFRDDSALSYFRQIISKRLPH